MKTHTPKVYARRLKMIQKSGTHLKEMDSFQEEEYVCMNCHTTFVGRFCPNCGQKATTKRLTFQEAFENLLGIFTNFERGFLHTCLDLCYRPGHMIRDYIKGHRVEYIQPVKLLFLLGTIYIMEHFLLYEDWFHEKVSQPEKIIDEETFAFLRPILEYLDNPPAWAILLILLMLIPNRLFFRKSPFGQTMNYAEHFYAMVFVACQLFIVVILTMPIDALVGYDYVAVKKICALLIVLDFYQLMGYKFWKTVRQCIKSVSLGFLFFILGAVLVACIGVGVYALIHGELPKEIFSDFE